MLAAYGSLSYRFCIASHKVEPVDCTMVNFGLHTRCILLFGLPVMQNIYKQTGSSLLNILLL